AARSIVDISPTGGRGAAAPFPGDYRTEQDFFTSFGTPVTPGNGNTVTLTQFLDKVKANGGLNGTWTLETVDTNTPAPTNPNFVTFWSLTFSTGLVMGDEVAMPPLTSPTLAFTPASSNQYFPQVVPGSLTQNFSTAAPSTPNGIGPGLVLASDNTLGSFSPY